MSQISDSKNPWRDILMSEPASFRGIIFHVENGGRNSGRRTVVHEYPKRNDPYSEDMGRQARRFSFSGYLVYRPSNTMYEYTSQRVRLYNALEQDDSGRLIHPVFVPNNTNMMVVCDRYSMTESRERGGYTQFEMSFVEAGSPGNSVTVSSNSGAVRDTASSAEKSAVKSFSNVETGQ